MYKADSDVRAGGDVAGRHSSSSYSEEQLPRAMVTLSIRHADAANSAHSEQRMYGRLTDRYTGVTEDI